MEPALPSDIEHLLADLRSALEDLYGDRLVQLVLYGSQARGETHEESDVDVLVVLEGPVEPGKEIRRMGEIRTRLGLRYEHSASLLPVAGADYENQPSAWIRNVHEEGRVI